jgi:hypothetical protein
MTFTGSVATTSTSTAAGAAPATGTTLARPASRAALTSVGPALEASPLLVSAHGDECLLDERDRVARILGRVVRP